MIYWIQTTIWDIYIR